MFYAIAPGNGPMTATSGFIHWLQCRRSPCDALAASIFCICIWGDCVKQRMHDGVSSCIDVDPNQHPLAGLCQMSGYKIHRMDGVTLSHLHSIFSLHTMANGDALLQQMKGVRHNHFGRSNKFRATFLRVPRHLSTSCFLILCVYFLKHEKE